MKDLTRRLVKFRFALASALALWLVIWAIYKFAM